VPASDARVQVLDSEVVARVFDGEAIIINVANGKYYSLDRAGTLIWSLLTGGGYTLKAAVTFVASRYAIDDAAVAVDIDNLATRLIDEGLVTIASDRAAPAAPVDVASLGGETWAPPTLMVYSDMTDVLALDPPLPEILEEDS